MEKIFVLILVFASIGFFLLKMINLFRGKDNCSGCSQAAVCRSCASICKVDKNEKK
jgi:hypothetical protein